MLEIKLRDDQNFEEIKFSNVGDVNPYFSEIGHEIVLPNVRYKDYEQHREHLASVVHEYYHFLQSVCTATGIYQFFGIAEKILATMYAIQGREIIPSPLGRFAVDNPEDGQLKHYLDCIKNYNAQVKAGRGDWFLKISKNYDEYDLIYEKKRIQEKEIDRFHLVRSYKGSFVGIPLLTDVIGEGQAEAVAAYYAGIDSDLLSSYCQERSESDLKYNTLPHLIRLGLRRYNTLEALFFCTDFSLMTFAPDAAFVEAFKFLESNTKIPQTREDWVELRFKLEKKSDIFQNTQADILKEVESKKRFYSLYKDRMPVFRIFLKRLEQFEKSLQFRTTDPLFLFPWGRSKQLLDHIFNLFPASHVRFIDGVYSLGNPSKEDEELHTLQVALRYLLSFVEGKPRRCPFCDDQITCTAERDPSCTSAPWMRGDLGGGMSCAFGQLGFLLGIQDSIVQDY